MDVSGGKMKYLFFDTETTGVSKTSNLVSIAWLLADDEGVTLHSEYHIIKPADWRIPEESIRIHKITQDMANKYGANQSDILWRFLWYVNEADVLVAHNIQFDQKIINYALKTYLGHSLMLEDYGKRLFCTMHNSKEVIGRITRNNKFKNPSLSEMYTQLFGSAPVGVLHNAMVDVQVLVQCFYKLWGTPCELPTDTLVLDLPGLSKSIIYEAAAAPIIKAICTSPTDPSDAV